jgi:hypothetical protein
MSHRTPGRPTRQILSGSQLAPTHAIATEPIVTAQPPSLAFTFLAGLAVLMITSAVVWALWGMSAATPILFLLAIGLIVSWLVL